MAITISYTCDGETPQCAAFSEDSRITRGWIDRPVLKELRFFSVFSVHICHCCSCYQISVFCNTLEIVSYRNPMWTHSGENAACCNMPGVLTVGRCSTSLSSTYIKCVVPTSKHSPQLNSTGLYNRASHSSICTPRVYVCPSLFFLGGPGNGKGEALVSKHVQTPAYLRCLAGFIITIHCKHTHRTDPRAQAQQKLRNSRLVVCKQNVAARKHYMDWLG